MKNRLPALGLGALSTILTILGWIVMAVRRQRAVPDDDALLQLKRANAGLAERILVESEDLRSAKERLAAAMADKETLYREVHHRVKNNLQVVSSLLQLQAARLPPEIRRPFEESVSRIGAMSLVHEILYRSDQPSRIDFAYYLRAVAEALLARRAAPDRVKLSVAAETTLVDLDTAVPLGLLVNELLSSLLDDESERAPTTLRLVMSSDPTGIHLTILSEGATADAMPSGLGLLLVEALADQIGASVSTEGGAKGGFLIFIPAAATHQHGAAAGR